MIESLIQRGCLKPTGCKHGIPRALDIPLFDKIFLKCLKTGTVERLVSHQKTDQSIEEDDEHTCVSSV